MNEPSIENTCDVCGETVVDAENRPYVLTALARHGFEAQFCLRCAQRLQPDESAIARLMTRAWLRAAGPRRIWRSVPPTPDRLETVPALGLSVYGARVEAERAVLSALGWGVS